MGRVTESEVEKIIAVDSSLDLAPFINTANLIVTDRLTGSGLSTAELKDVELWLTAHFVAVYDPRAAQEKVGDASVTFEGKTGMGLDFTRYGQMAKLLDSSGTLANMGKRKASITAIDIIDD